MADEKPPEHKPQVPAPLMRGLSPQERYVYEQLSIANQDNKWLMEKVIEAGKRDAEADVRIMAIEKRVGIIEDLRKIISAKWSIIVVIIVGVVNPILFGILGAWLKSKF